MEQVAGTLTQEWAKRTGLPAGISVAVGALTIINRFEEYGVMERHLSDIMKRLLDLRARVRG